MWGCRHAHASQARNGTVILNDVCISRLVVPTNSLFTTDAYALPISTKLMVFASNALPTVTTTVGWLSANARMDTALLVATVCLTCLLAESANT